MLRPLLFSSTMGPKRIVCVFFIQFFARISAQAAAQEAPCECVPYYLCDANGFIIIDGTGGIDERFGKAKCDDPLAACCKVPPSFTNQPPFNPEPCTPNPYDPTTPPQRVPINNSTLRPPPPTPSPFSPPNVSPTPKPPTPSPFYPPIVNPTPRPPTPNPFYPPNNVNPTPQPPNPNPFYPPNVNPTPRPPTPNPFYPPNNVKPTPQPPNPNPFYPPNVNPTPQPPNPNPSYPPNVNPTPQPPTPNPFYPPNVSPTPRPPTPSPFYPPNVNPTPQPPTPSPFYPPNVSPTPRPPIPSPFYPPNVNPTPQPPTPNPFYPPNVSPTPRPPTPSPFYPPNVNPTPQPPTPNPFYPPNISPTPQPPTPNPFYPPNVSPTPRPPTPSPFNPPNVNPTPQPPPPNPFYPPHVSPTSRPPTPNPVYPPLVNPTPKPPTPNSSIGADIIVPQFGCGVRRERGSSGPLKQRILEGDTGDTFFAELPWMVALLDARQSPKRFKCGGSLIHPKVILTAAHCVRNVDISTLVVRAGEWDSQSTSEHLRHEDKRVAKVIMHPNFNPGNLWYDIAVISTESPFELKLHIDTICLPPKGFSFDNMRCVVAGWGKDGYGSTSDHDGKYSAILRKVQLPILPRDTCQALFRKTRLGKFFLLHESFICAGGEPDKDACQGDGGGPLMCALPQDQSRWAQIGVVSWGIGCGQDPGAYTNVPLFIDWIVNQIRLLVPSNTMVP